MQVPAQVEYEKATSVQHALALLARYGPEAKVLAGGHSLIPMMKLRLAQPELLVDINTQLDATILVVTHNIALARTLPDNIGMLFRRSLVTFGPREVLLTTREPVIDQFLTGRRAG